MQKEKEKPKRKVSGNHLEFVSPLSLYMCANCLKELGKYYSSDFMRFTNTSVKYETIDSESDKFSIQQGYVVVNGSLIAQDASSTLVICDSDLNLLAKLIYIPFALVIAVGSLAMSAEIGLAAGVMLMIPCGIILLSAYYKFYRTRNELLGKVQRLLTLERASTVSYIEREQRD